MTKAKTETPEQAERRRERNRQRRKAAATAKRHEASIKTVMERAAAARPATGKATNKAVEAPKPATATGKAPKAPQTPTEATRAPTAPTLDRRAHEWGFKAGVNGQLIDPGGESFFPFHPADLTHPQDMLHNEAAIRGRAMGALEQLAEFFASRVTGRMPSKAEMRLAALVEALAYELSAVADAIPAILADMADLQHKCDQVKAERDQLKTTVRQTEMNMRQFIGQFVYVEGWPEAE